MPATAGYIRLKRPGLFHGLLALLIVGALTVSVPTSANAAGPRTQLRDFQAAQATVDPSPQSRPDEVASGQLTRPDHLLSPDLALDTARPAPAWGEHATAPASPANDPVALTHQASEAPTPKTLSSSGWLGMNNTINAAYYGCTPADLCVEPPDPSVAVGPNDVVQTVNTHMRIYDRSGNVRGSIALPTFFGTEWDLLTSDPQVAYHAQTGRWFMTIISADCFSGYLHLAVSDTSDPMGSWSKYTYEYANSLPDYPGLGFSGDKVVIGVNEFDLLDCYVGTYLGTSALVADIPDLLDDSSHWYVTTSPDDDMWNWRPAAGQGPDGDAHAVITDYYGTFYHLLITGSVVDFAEYGPDPLEIYLDDLYFEFAPQEELVLPVQPGGPLQIDGRVTSAVWSAGRLVFVSTYPCLEDWIYDCVRVSELDTSTLYRRQDFLIGEPAAYYDSFMGGIALTDDGTLYVVWTRSRGDSPASIWATYQTSSNPLDDVEPYSLIRPGAGAYLGYRWGDYAILADDPNDSHSVWQAHEFALSSGGWGTFVSQLGTASTPGAPTGAHATAGNGQALVSWSAPSSDGGSSITTYTVTSAPGAKTCATNGTTYSCSVTGLTNGTPYTFTVVASNAAGDGPPSAASNSVTPTAGLAAKPDGRIRKGTGAYVGNNIYNTTGLNQAKTGAKARGATVTFGISIQNDGSGTDSFRLSATGTASSMYTVTYFRGTTDITAAVVAGTYTTPSLAPGATYLVTAKVKVNQSATKGSSTTRLVTVASVADGTKQDAVMFTGKRL